MRSRCRGGSSWTLDWAPRHGDATFRQRGDRLVVREVVERPQTGGRISRIGAVMTAQVDRERAGGEIRIVSRVHRGGREVQACDSGPVQWAASEAVAAAVGDPVRELLAYAAYVDAHAAQLRALEQLGPPPDGAELHARWIGNMRERIRLERAVLGFAEAGERDRVYAINRRIVQLKMDGNAVGQRFGLQICTSNGPGRTPVPH